MIGTIGTSSRTLRCFLYASVLTLATGSILAQDVPRYRFDPTWPKELPHNWILGHVEGIAVDKQDHIWLVHDPRSVPADDASAAQKPPTTFCCVAAPPVIELDRAGNVLNAWGGPDLTPDWPTMVHGLWVDAEGNVWLAGAWDAEFNLPAWQRPSENAPWDRHVLKFSPTGKLLLEIGHPSKAPINNQDTTLLGGPSSIQVDELEREVFIADGYMNKRIVVYDSVTGEFKRGWGAYGVPLDQIDNKPQLAYDHNAPAFDPNGPAPKDFRGPLVGMRLSADGLLYVSDRTDNRIQVFSKSGKFVQEFFVAKSTLSEGVPWAMAFSHDKAQKYLFVGDGMGNVIWILNRKNGSVAGMLGHKGHNGGQFDKIDGLALDSDGNLYTGEVHYNNRVQRFNLAH